MRVPMVIECIPNVSEGRRLDVVAMMADALGGVAGIRLLNYSSDGSHNRSVFTFVGDATAVGRAAIVLVERAVASIDLRTHRGEHPRIGAVDVVPFVPIADATMADCVALSKEVGRDISQHFGRIPVYLYEAASTNPARTRLEDIRRGGFEGLRDKMARPGWTPDFGPHVPHPTAGATVVGARLPLIAYNINLATDRLAVAKRIAAVIRSSSGGLPAVKAIGVTLAERGIVQVSINLTNYEQTGIVRVYDAAKAEAEKEEVEVLDSEIIGLVPQAALAEAERAHVRLAGFTPDQVLEYHLKIRPSG